MARITRYGPVLDTAIDVVKELTQRGVADVYVPMHPQAAGMAADMSSVLLNLYPYIDSEIYFPGILPRKVEGQRTDRVRQLLVRYKFERESFEMLGLDEFSTYPFITLLDLDVDGKQTVSYKSKVSVTARNINISAPINIDSTFISAVRRCIRMPPERNLITLKFVYQSASGFPVNTSFQDLPVVKRFSRKQTDRGGYNYPVSIKDRHEIDHESWQFFNSPVFWDSWSQYSSIALAKMSGRRAYDAAANYYSEDVDNILRHSMKAEPTVVKLLRHIKDGKNPEEVAAAVGCPPEYTHLYFRKILRSINWLCNPGSLKDPEKSRYLQNLSRACAEYGFDVSPQQLACL